MVGPLKLKNRDQVGTVADELKHAQILGYTVTINDIQSSKDISITHYSNSKIVRQSRVGPRGSLKVEEK